MTDTLPLSLTLPRVALLDALTVVLDYVGTKCYGLFTATAEVLTIAAADGGGGGRYTLSPVRTITPGTCVIPLTLLAKTLRHSEGATVAITTTRAGVRVTISSQDAPPRPFEFFHHDPDTIPLPADQPPTDTLTLPAADFRHLVSRVAFAAERRERDSAPAGWSTIGGLLTLARKSLTLAATDTYRLAVASMPLPPSTPLRLQAGSTGRARKPAAVAEYLLPVKSWKAFAESSREAESLTLSLSPTQAMLDAGNLRAWAPLLSGRFPPTAAALVDLPHAFTLPTARFLTDVEAALAFCHDDDPAVVLAVAPGLVTLSPESGDRGTCELVTRVPGLAGPRLTVALHGSRLVSILNAYLDCPEVRVMWSSADRPLVICAGRARCLFAPRLIRERSAA